MNENSEQPQKIKYGSDAYWQAVQSAKEWAKRNEADPFAFARALKNLINGLPVETW